MKIKLYFVRHGQAEHNIDPPNRYDDPKYEDAHLTPLGKEQALKAGEILKDVNFDRIYCSPLTRTIETLMLILSKNNKFDKQKRIRLDDDILEMQGNHTSDKRKEKKFVERFVSTTYPEYKFLSDDINEINPYLGEREKIDEKLLSDKIKSRAIKFVEKVKKEKLYKVLIVSHNILLLNLFKHYTGEPVDFKNGEIRKIEFEIKDDKKRKYLKYKNKYLQLKKLMSLN